MAAEPRRIACDGNTIAYVREGVAGDAVLLVQGAGVIGNGWRPQIDTLAATHDLIAFDNRGIGASSCHGPLSIEAMAADALAILDREGIDRAHVVGHSMGGLIAQEIALRAPGRVRSLALLCTFAHGGQAARFSLDLTLAAIAMRVGPRSRRRDAFLALVLPRPWLATQDRTALASSLAPLFGHDLAAQPRVVFTQLRAMGRYDPRARQHALGGVPTLVVSAAHDRIAPPAFGRELAAAIPGARFVEIADAGHAVPIQCPELINSLLVEHFDRAR
jgi:pimeloyl-ACP methyl ester carboxylesterase